MVLSEKDWESEGYFIWISVGGDSCCGSGSWFKVNVWGSVNN